MVEESYKGLPDGPADEQEGKWMLEGEKEPVHQRCSMATTHHTRLRQIHAIVLRPVAQGAHSDVAISLDDRHQLLFHVDSRPASALFTSPAIAVEIDPYQLRRLLV